MSLPFKLRLKDIYMLCKKSVKFSYKTLLPHNFRLELQRIQLREL